jgi:hypothetical protein
VLLQVLDDEEVVGRRRDAAGRRSLLGLRL